LAVPRSYQFKTVTTQFCHTRGASAQLKRSGVEHSVRNRATRTAIFQWTATQEKILYAPRLPIRPVGVYFSPASRNFDAPRFLASYRGTLLLLLQNHIEFQIVTPRTLATFRGSQLILPDVSFLADIERSELKNFLAGHGRLMISGLDSTALPASAQIMHFKESPAVAYLTRLEKGIAEGSKHVPAEFLAALQPNPEFLIEAGPLVAVNIGSVDGKPHAFFLNFAGLVPHRNLVPSPESNARIVVPASCKCGLDFLPFLGKVRRIEG